MLERYGHGGDLVTASDLFGITADQFVDFSSNMNPFGPPAAVFAVMESRWRELDRYPDPAVRGLRSKLAQRHGINVDNVLCGNGAAELIDLAIRALRPNGGVGLAVPCFGEYADAAEKYGGHIVRVPMLEDDSFRLSVERVMEAALGDNRPEIWMIGSPNNPTGMTVDRELILKLLDTEAFVVIDEAFLDFVPNEEAISLVQEAAKRPNLLVIRSMTKFYAIPGIRLGYAVGSADTIAKMRGLQTPWSVNSLAQWIGEAVLDDVEYEQRTRRWLTEERQWLSADLGKLGCKVFDSVTNYLLVKLPDECAIDAAQLQQLMGQRGVLIRDASHFAGLDGRFIRLAVKLREQNERLIEALSACLQVRRL
ncbi:L-threonine O-3-phosphate decarboxylase [Paenibacillus cellulosilyticus]|uniref:threonine-phosphate decarboxylase n=1 Tax=Paenibacillus cellulosilyticus TaxID=375489 RepID=A0A2V2YY07_9BACL|nr:threonine-phosphate decarboxylase CobD [Paenibacillus cellulosilyticus]PWW06504.1 L-threonine O-3-phosphate decarboxylase [Paenibacillus cellulosilyticus]QKS46157.1 threonine-phosphate decarboxylase [Paenibacillus cellulosilyticus]